MSGSKIKILKVRENVKKYISLCRIGSESISDTLKKISLHYISTKGENFIIIRLLEEIIREFIDNLEKEELKLFIKYVLLPNANKVEIVRILTSKGRIPKELVREKIGEALKYSFDIREEIKFLEMNFLLKYLNLIN